MKACVIFWFRCDLRLQDNPALSAAVATGLPVIPVFIASPKDANSLSRGAASKWWLHHSLEALASDLHQRGARLIVRAAESACAALEQLIVETGATGVFWNRRYEPDAVACDSAIERQLRAGGVAVQSFQGSVLLEPHAVRTQAGKPYQVYTPFWRACVPQIHARAPLAAPMFSAAPAVWPTSVPLASLALEPRLPWADGLAKAWQPGEGGARAQMKQALANTVSDYDRTRDRPDSDGTSRLAPHLHFGEVSVNELWHLVDPEAEAFRRQLVWRDFARHLLFEFPHTATEPLRPKYAAMPWADNLSGLRAWQRGETGFPIVDAGMRQLWKTGWMHNRVRMIVGSFLVKDLLLPWQQGAAWFWDTLVDADLANNTLGWQWVAGCGADAAPFFRVFNPMSQGEKFDPDGVYVRRYIPALSSLPAKYIHRPWMAPAQLLAGAGVRLGRTYPRPLVDHAAARRAALAAYQTISSRGS